MTLVTGNTYPHRRRLRELGGVWDPQSKGWAVPDEAGDEAIALVEGGSRAPRSPYWRDRYAPVMITRLSSGHVITRNRAGKCIDAPCCGCCSG